jgi:uncharacterized protein (DUF697 family)
MKTATRWFGPLQREARLRGWFAKVRDKVPVPVFWLLGRTQSGKTSLIKYLTGASDAEIGQGFQPCTRTSRRYQFPSDTASLVTFLDTRGLDEPGYDATEDLAQFDQETHVILVTVRALDHAQQNLLANLPAIRQARPGRPILLFPTCLHEAYPQQQHPLPYPFGTPAEALAVPENLRRTLEEQKRRFAGLVDAVVPIDLTPPEEGFDEPAYGGPQLKAALLEALPAAYRQTLATLDEAQRDLKEDFARHALPHILGYSTLAATAGSFPIPWLDLLILAGIQTQMIYHLARYYGQPLAGRQFLELASTLGLGIAFRQACREVLKFIPYVGSVAGGMVAGAATYALGKAFCYYYQAVHEGHVPRPDELRRYYSDQLSLAEKAWKR